MQWVSRSKPLRAVSKDGSIHVTDEFFNTLTTVFGLVFFLFGSSYLVIRAVELHKIWHIIGFSLYAFGSISLFLMSTLHHGIDASPKTEKFFRQLDYCAIFLVIAGTQSPFFLIMMRTPLGLGVFWLEWVLAALGIALKLSIPGIPKKITTSIYILMGWLGIFCVPAMIRQLGIVPLALLLAGGLLYTVGALIFQFERPNPIPGKLGFHEIWHTMVVTASLCHFGVMIYLLRL